MSTEVLNTTSQPPSMSARLDRLVLPPLEPGDHLTREEFERRYEAMTHVKKTELIDSAFAEELAARMQTRG